MQEYLRIHESDNVIVALKPLPEGTVVSPEEGVRVKALQEIPAGHKMAIRDIPEGGEVIKYGYRIGIAKEAIPAGTWIHTHNVKTGLGEILEYRYEPEFSEPVPTAEATFMGYVRKDGKVGVRNDIWIVPTVGCMNNVATAIARMGAEYASGDSEVFAFTHPYGCSQMGDDQ
nr:altronate dehydratase family protein [Lachnospiraceae bacterium]